MDDCREKFIGRDRSTTGFFVDREILDKAETEEYQTLYDENKKIVYSPVKKEEMRSPAVDFVLDSEVINDKQDIGEFKVN